MQILISEWIVGWMFIIRFVTSIIISIIGYLSLQNYTEYVQYKGETNEWWKILIYQLEGVIIILFQNMKLVNRF